MSALLAVGEDCSCGHPLVWRHGERWCAVYGRHKPVDEWMLKLRFNRAAELAHVVIELDSMPEPQVMRERRRMHGARVVNAA